MITLPSELCQADITRGQLKHSWIENEIQGTQPTNVVNRRRDGSWERDGKITKFIRNIELTRQLAHDMIQGFSPSQLVNQLGPLQKLSAEIRANIEKAVHDSYLESSDIEDLADDLRLEVEIFAKEFKKFSEVWQKGDDAALRNAWQGVLEKAEALLSVFERLPNGVVLP